MIWQLFFSPGHAFIWDQATKKWAFALILNYCAISPRAALATGAGSRAVPLCCSCSPAQQTQECIQEQDPQIKQLGVPDPSTKHHLGAGCAHLGKPKVAGGAASMSSSHQLTPTPLNSAGFCPLPPWSRIKPLPHSSPGSQRHWCCSH